MQMDFDAPVELVRGEIIEMPQPDQLHGAVCFNVGFLVGTWARPGQLGTVTTNDSGVLTERAPDTVRGADVCYFANEAIPGGHLKTGQVDLIPTLCVEVLSPSNRPADIEEKVDEYLARGVSEVWLVDPTTRSMQVIRASRERRSLSESDELISDHLSGFVCRVSEFFEGV